MMNQHENAIIKDRRFENYQEFTYMHQNNQFTEGKIFGPLIRFAIPVLFALCLQSLYGAVDLLVVGRFVEAKDVAAAVSAVSNGSQIMHMVTMIVTSLAMGTTIMLGQAIGSGKKKEAGDIIGSSICFFLALAIVLTIIMLIFADTFAGLLHVPEEAFDKTVTYTIICSAGMIFIVSYNVVGSIFRGLGDSKTPLFTVLCACVLNIIGDLVFVAVLDMQASGAAAATVMAQAFSVLLCLVIIRKRELPFEFSRKNIRFEGKLIARIFKIGFPIALQESLVSISFLVIAAIVNGLGVIASAGVGVAEKICGFIMLVPSSFSQSLSAFVAQNIGAGKLRRARQAMLCGMMASLVAGLCMGYMAFFHGDMLAAIFANEAEVIYAAEDYLKSYAIDTCLVAFLFCYIGYFNGCGKTTMVMLQGIIGAFGVRVPVSYFMSKLPNTTLFKIGLATPASTIVQIIFCSVCLWFLIRGERRSADGKY